MLVTLIGWLVVVSATILPLTKLFRRVRAGLAERVARVRRGPLTGSRRSFAVLATGLALCTFLGIAGVFLIDRSRTDGFAASRSAPVPSKPAPSNLPSAPAPFPQAPSTRAPSTPDPAPPVASTTARSAIASPSVPGAILYADFEQDSATFVSAYVDYADSTPGFTRIFTGGNNCLRLGTTTERAFEGARSFEVSWIGDTLPINHTPPPVPPQSACELRGTLGGGHQELWFRTMIYVPDNYIQRNVVGKSENDKFLWICGGYVCQEETDPYDVKVIAEFNAYETAPGDSSVLKPNWGTNASDGGLVISQHGLPAVKFIVPEDRGTWIDLCMHFRISDDTTSTSPPNSVMQAWKGTTRLWDFSEFALRDAQNMDEVFWHFYLMGANNGGYPDTTRFYFDNLGFYDSDPGCGN